VSEIKAFVRQRRNHDVSFVPLREIHEERSEDRRLMSSLFWVTSSLPSSPVILAQMIRNVHTTWKRRVAFVSVRPWVFVLETVVKDESHRKEETLSSQFPDPSRQSSANPPKRAQKKRFPGSQVLVSTGLTRLAVTHLGNH
jgi:hypothetical protein